MFRALTLISALTSVVLAQSSSSSAAAGRSTANPLIPSAASTECSTFLNNLNGDSVLKTCLSAITSATSAFAPGSNTAASKTTVTSALSTLCSDAVSNACPEQIIRADITELFAHCTKELTTGKVPEVIRFYDTLYSIIPMRTSACSKDDSGNYCVLSSPKSAAKDLAGSLYSPASGSSAQVAIIPNIKTFHDNNIAFLFYKPDLDATSLCTTCARQVLTAYMTFESNVAYGPGLSNSPLLDNQPALLAAVKDKCPAGFLNGAVQAAGGLSGGVLSSAALATFESEQNTMIALAMGLSTLAVSSLF